MSDILSSRSIGLLASYDLPEGLGLEEVVTSLVKNDKAYWEVQGALRKRYPDIVRSVERLSNRADWCSAVLLRCEQEFESWIYDPYAPLAYLALALARGERGSRPDPNSLWYWPTAISRASGREEPPPGVRMLPLASDSMIDVLKHLEAGLVRHIERLGPDDPETLGFQGRRDILEKTLGFHLSDKLGPRASTALRAFDERTGYQALVHRMIDELPESVPEELRQLLRAGVSQYEADLEYKRRSAVFEWTTNMASAGYRTPHESSWW